MSQDARASSTAPKETLTSTIAGKLDNIGGRLDQINERLGKKVGELVPMKPEPNGPAAVSKVPSGWGETTIDRLDQMQATVFSIESALDRLANFI